MAAVSDPAAPPREGFRARAAGEWRAGSLWGCPPLGSGGPGGPRTATPAACRGCAAVAGVVSERASSGGGLLSCASEEASRPPPWGLGGAGRVCPAASRVSQSRSESVRASLGAARATSESQQTVGHGGRRGGLDQTRVVTRPPAQTA